MALSCVEAAGQSGTGWVILRIETLHLSSHQWFPRPAVIQRGGYISEVVPLLNIRVDIIAEGSLIEIAQVLFQQAVIILEVDAVIEGADGQWAAFEVKLGATYVEEAAANLLRFADRVDTSRVGPPTALGVIVPGGYGYRRPDGVSVLPLAAMGP